QRRRRRYLVIAVSTTAGAGLLSAALAVSGIGNGQPAAHRQAPPSSSSAISATDGAGDTAHRSRIRADLDLPAPHLAGAARQQPVPPQLEAGVGSRRLPAIDDPGGPVAGLRRRWHFGYPR